MSASSACAAAAAAAAKTASWTHALTSPSGLTVLRHLPSGLTFSPAHKGAFVGTAPGSIWGDFGRSCPASNTIIANNSLHLSSSCSNNNSSNENIKEKAAPQVAVVETAVSGSFQSYGEQAGLLLYANQSTWVKLVLECMKDGVTRVVFAKSEAGTGPAVTAKIDSPAAQGQGLTAALRLTVTEAGAADVAEAATTVTVTAEVKVALDANAQGYTTVVNATDIDCDAAVPGAGMPAVAVSDLGEVLAGVEWATIGATQLPSLASTTSASGSGSGDAAATAAEVVTVGGVVTTVVDLDGSEFKAGLMAHGAPAEANRATLFRYLTVSGDGESKA